MMKKFLALTAFAIALTSTAGAGEYPDVSIKELKEAIAAQKVVVLDVNGSKSYQKAHIPTAIDFRKNKKEIAELLPKDKSTLVVAYCGGPSCQAYQAGAKAAKKLGYTNVKHLSAGISGWVQAGEKTEKGEPKKKGEKKEKKAKKEKKESTEAAS